MLSAVFLLFFFCDRCYKANGNCYEHFSDLIRFTLSLEMILIRSQSSLNENLSFIMFYVGQLFLPFHQWNVYLINTQHTR